MTIKLRVNLDELTWEQYEAVQDAAAGGVNFRQFREIVAQFMVDERGEPVPVDEARRALGKLKMPEIKEAINALAEGMQLPPASGGA